MKLTFRASCSIEDSQFLLVAGSCEELGSWDVKNSLVLNQVSEGRFEGTIEVAGGSCIEYKYVLADSNKEGRVRWEGAGNRKVEAKGEDFVQDDRPFESGMGDWIAGETPKPFTKTVEKVVEELSNGTAVKENGVPQVNGKDLDIPQEKLCKPFWKFWQSDEDYKTEVIEEMAKK
mmetsp:Transcript_4644/g.14030  ORF Transcript_4644/g.14030 Transcript_4644/m.14030 type:complete len:175 (+) Transcript_4644:90-614(+)|eukprot:CAMPEP_0198736434 /NCGR_PEP_ID=MMETSP1475-20131203/65693_1 /TAXON_ID= ORGANISM="Unidentified sp., Strain CCMP1999" /NCGR_SAMPLE_ID=MMETSP1475 /ASSEMBLY_ACC=CAM_ASM_001111 /LENGTH=174 /DNA_ID=CAMNT_0044500243 /DNA_START=60 /DNA_END=584 /DNA_ORIENTATION=+